MSSDDAQSAPSGPYQDLRQKLINHVLFVHKRGGERLFLRDQDLTRLIIDNLRLDQAWFAGCYFTFCSFANTSFANARLGMTTFSHCDLTGCDFTNAELKALSVTHSSVAQVKIALAKGNQAYMNLNQKGEYAVSFNTRLTRSLVTDFSNSDFRGADLSGAMLKGAIFRNANFEGANLTGANLEGADLGGANLSKAKFTDANLTNVNFEGATFSPEQNLVSDIRGTESFASFLDGQTQAAEVLAAHENWALSNGKEGKKADFRNMTLNGVDFRYRHLAAIDFSNSVLRACLFTEAILAASFFNDVQARFCNFDHIDGRGMQMQKGHFAFCSFIESDFDDLPVGKGNKVLKTNFDGTKLTNCDLTKAKLSPKQLAPATLISCKK